MKIRIDEKMSKREINEKVKDFIQNKCSTLGYSFFDHPEEFGIEDGSDEYEYFVNQMTKYLKSMLKSIGRDYYSQ